MTGKGRQVNQISETDEACEMQNAQTYLEIVNQRGQRGLELRRVYRQLQNSEFYLQAYGKLYANKGATTPGINPQDTVDGMTLTTIDNIQTSLKQGQYKWSPTRRIHIPKAKGKTRPLGVSGWRDKLLQEVIRQILSAYYEPQFSENSHGFRPGRGCHTALNTIRRKWIGTKWFIEGDIKACFDEIDHEKLLTIIAKTIKDERLVKLLRQMLQAGYMEDWRYNRTYSGTPQGNVLSPLLANIFLNELDKFVENTLIPQYSRGKKRRNNPRYNHQQSQIAKARRHGDRDQCRKLTQELRTIPSMDNYDENFRRLKYIRYADDFLIGFIGPKSEAEDIKHKIGKFLAELGLTLSPEKTLITHAHKQRARFLGYDIHIAIANTKQYKKRRTINGKVMLSVPQKVIQEWVSRHRRNGKPEARTSLIQHADYDIVMKYQLELQGLVNYYKLAYNVSKLHRVKSSHLQSLVKTLARKHKKSARWVYQRYYSKQSNGLKALVVTVTRERKPPLIAQFGGYPIRYDKTAVLEDKQVHFIMKRTQLVDRLLADKCELCGSIENINVHHIRKLKDLKRRYAGRKQPPEWVKRMIEIRRKTLVVCHQCHHTIHAGTYDGVRLN